MRHTNGFVTQEERELERQSVAQEEAAGAQPRFIKLGDDEALKSRMVDDCLARYGRFGG
jgi:hypothetical protein